ncbi:MAG: hypothetical protein M3Y44_06645 [Actinomycetota bacterium]|nr:hypothetical protein [Actinomycetota bacterium]
MTATTDVLTEAVQAAARSVARRGIGFVVGAFAGSQTVVHAAGPVSGSSGHTALWHNGGTSGFASYVALMPTANAGVVVLADRARSVDRPGVRLLSTLTETARHV